MAALAGAGAVEEDAAECRQRFLAEKFEAARDGVFGRGGIDRAGIGGVHPDETVLVVAAPGGERRVHQMFLEAAARIFGLAETLLEAGDFRALAGHVTEPQDGERAGRAAFRLEGAAVGRLDMEREAGAARAQALHRRVEAASVFRFEARQQIGEVEVARGGSTSVAVEPTMRGRA